jgi:hypothetical protein
VGDRRVGEHALGARLNDRDDVAEHHREHRQRAEAQDEASAELRQSCEGAAGPASRSTKRNSTPKLATFTVTAMNPVTTLSAPS